MRPSFVRSNIAPHSSSSRTRSGASCACSCAMRQLFSSLPPRMVSRKWIFQLSSFHTLPIAEPHTPPKHPTHHTHTPPPRRHPHQPYHSPLPYYSHTHGQHPPDSHHS